MRNLLLFILLLVAIWWVRRALKNLRGGGRGAPHASGQAGKPRALGEPEPMLACDQCGVHVPESEGVREADAFFCCEEHRRQFVRR